MYDAIKELLDSIWGTLEAVGYAEDKLHFRGESIGEEFRLHEKYGERSPELLERVHKDAKQVITTAINRYEDALMRSGE